MLRERQNQTLSTTWSELRPAEDYAFHRVINKWTTELGVTDKELLQALSVKDKRTLKSWKKDSVPQTEARSTLKSFAEIYNQIREDFETPELARSWLRADHLSLRGLSPLDLLKMRRIDVLKSAYEEVRPAKN